MKSKNYLSIPSKSHTHICLLDLSQVSCETTLLVAFNSAEEGQHAPSVMCNDGMITTVITIS